MCRHLLISVAVAGVLPCALHAQTDTTARLTGTARSSFNGRPLAGVMVSVPAARKFVVTDSTGAFSLFGLPTGRQRVLVAYQGRKTEEFDFDLQSRKTKQLAVLLDVEAIDLAPVVVEVQNRDFSRNLAGFYDRRKWYGGFARFYTREDIERRHFGTVSQMLTLDGIFTRSTSRGWLPVRWSRGVVCPVAVTVDGMPFWEQDYETIALREVQAVEIYRGGFGAPLSSAATATFSQLDGPTTGTCGWVMIWTR
jgi:hypothetical protein